ncbi:MAG TPA: hypothetical protein VLK82_15690 [Candidatus Tectomicrobia bacterium]|nr:hypothetical protein [Candidatus Tectomicrobia bacterium]
MPDASTPPPVRYCPPGQHRWAPRYADDHPRQCWDCPECERQAPAQGTLLEASRGWAETVTTRKRR